MKPTYEQVNELLAYDPVTGVLTWKVNRRGSAKAGTEAGSIEAKRKNRYTQYRRIHIFDVKYFAHHVAVLLMTGEWPDMVDHDDRNGLNNAWANLIITDFTNNNRNRGFKNSPTGYTGIYPSKTKGKYCVYVGNDGVSKYRGTRNTLDEAIKLRNEIYQLENYHPNHGETI